jgi:hypothetical protein
VIATGNGGYTVEGPNTDVPGMILTDTLTNIENASFDATGQSLSMGDFVAQSFNPLVYLASNSDLLQAYGDNQQYALQHFLLHGYYEGRGQGSFNALQYIASNPDLLVAYGDNQTLGLEHYVLHGYYEGRSATSFNYREYLASNTDLLAAWGDNQTLALEHYILHGYAEGRQMSFNPLAYIAANPDLLVAYGDNQELGLDHYVLHGFGEGRTTSFDVLEYVASNSDLAKAWGSTYAANGYEHYILHGYYEGRQTDSFDPVAYLLSNSDLQTGGWTAQSALLHYLDHGVKEERTTGAFGSEQTQHALTLGTALSDTIGTAGDEDWFSIDLSPSPNYTISVSGLDSGQGTLADPVLQLRNQWGQLLTTDNDSGPGRDSLTTITNPAAGLYYLQVASNSPTATGTYKIIATQS